MWFNVIGATTSHEGAVITSFPSCYGKAANFQTAAILKMSSVNTQRTAIIFIHSLPSTTQLPQGETLFHFPPINNLEMFKDSSTTTRKYSKTFLPANFSQPQIISTENIQRPFRLKNCLSRKSPTISRKYSKTFWAAINSNNQQQQTTAAINSNNQQHQSTAAINSSNQQQQSTTAINSSTQQQQSATAINSGN